MSNTELFWARPGSSPRRIMLIDGPNMPNLGKRNRQVYGPIGSIEELQDYVKTVGKGLGVEVETLASNYEGAILEAVHASAETIDGYIVNPGGLASTGESFRHALEESGKPWVEVHFANPLAPPWSARGIPGGPVQSNFTRSATGAVMGLRHHSYLGALVALVSALDDENFLGASVQ